MEPEQMPLWPGPKLAKATSRGWVAFDPGRIKDLPPGKTEGPMGCGQSESGLHSFICTDHGDGYHAAAVGSPSGPRIIAVWLDGAK